MKNINIRKIVSIIVLFVLILTILPINSVLGVTPKSYTVSDGVSANLDSSGVLTITGTGEIPDYSSETQIPWNGEQIKKLVINDGITRIGNYAFYGLEELEEITWSNTLISIGEYAFYSTFFKYICVHQCYCIWYYNFF